MHPDTHTTVIMKSAQTGGTEVLLNVCGYIMDLDPSPILMLQPTLQMAEDFSKDRLALMIRDTPVLCDLVADARSRDSGNTLLHKQYLGGHITIVGANSPAGLRSRPIRIVVADEVDSYPASAGAEGDPLSLAIKRTENFWNRKIILVSTPTVKEISRIEPAYLESDQRKFYVPCQHCQEPQELVWKQVVWTPRPPELAVYVCAHCGVEWSESDRLNAIRSGEWRASAPFKGVAGFHLSALYSPWTTLGKIATEFVQAKPFPERLKTWVNTVLGQTWEEAHDAKDPEVLKLRAEKYGLGFAPMEVLIITMAVDVQGDRLEAYTWGYGEGEEAWVLDYRRFEGDPARPVVWDQLLEHMDRPIQHASGALMIPRTVVIDSGGLHTQIVYLFCRSHAARNIEFG